MKKRNTPDRETEITEIIKELSDKPYGEVKKIDKKVISISIPINIYNNIANEVHERKINGEKGVNVSNIISNLLNKYDL